MSTIRLHQYDQACSYLIAKKYHLDAAHLFEAGAKKGHVDSMYAFGNMLIHGHGIQRNFIEAIYHIERAANLGHVQAQFDLGAVLSNIKPCQPNTEDWDSSMFTQKAIHYFKLAADKGHAQAQYRLGMYFRHGFDFAKKDSTLALHWFTLAANQGHSKSLQELSLIYLTGEGVEKDVFKGMELRNAFDKSSKSKLPDYYDKFLQIHPAALACDAFMLKMQIQPNDSIVKEIHPEYIALIDFYNKPFSSDEPLENTFELPFTCSRYTAYKLEFPKIKGNSFDDVWHAFAKRTVSLIDPDFTTDLSKTNGMLTEDTLLDRDLVTALTLHTPN